MKILLINPPSPIGGPSVPTLGLMYLASIAKTQGAEVKIIDLDIDITLLGMIDEIIRYFNPEIVGITGTTPQANNLIKIAAEAKKISKKILVTAGGPHASALPVQLLKEADGNIDIVVFGEGEDTFKEILKGTKLSEIDGIAFYKNGLTVKNKHRKPIEDLDSIPFPDRSLVDIHRYPGLYPVKQSPSMHIVASRGCPFGCNFCSEKAVFGRKYRKRSTENVAEEIKLLIKNYNAREIAFYDDLFTADKKWVLSLCDRIRLDNLNFSWKVLSRVNTVDYELLRKMKEAGCWLIYYGFESGSQKILDSIRKGTTVEQNLHIAKLTKKVGMKIYGFFMLGNPGETRETAMDTIKHAKKISPDWFQFSITRPDPGSDLYNTYLPQIESKLTSWENYYAFPKQDIKMPVVGTELTPKELFTLREKADNYLQKSSAKIRNLVRSIFMKILCWIFAENSNYIFNKIRDALFGGNPDLENSVIIITGAGRGIGRSLAIMSAKMGMNVVAIARTQKDIESLADETKKSNGKILGINADISRESDIKMIFRKTLEIFSKIDFIVNNAAVGFFDKIENIQQNQINAMINTNLIGTINLTRYLANYMLRRQKGAIINVSSMLGLNAGKHESVYAATKFGVIGFTTALAKELKDFGIIVSVVCPGTVETDFANGRNKSAEKSNVLLPDEVTATIIKCLNKSSRIVSIVKWRNKTEEKVIKYL